MDISVSMDIAAYVSMEFGESPWQAEVVGLVAGPALCLVLRESQAQWTAFFQWVASEN